MQYLYFIYIQGIYDNLGRIDAPNPVYPCAYREGYIIYKKIENSIGLSLCIQGTLQLELILTSFARFIPVHTGNMAGQLRLWIYRIGLSLCIQGTLRYYGHIQQLDRFIPVHTGNIKSRCVEINLLSVYPCAYREHPSSGWTVSANSGLSLCIQGTFFLVLVGSYFFRFIPVHTGNIWPKITISVIFAVYPCAYREHKKHALQTTHNPGLSLCIQGT